MQTKTVCRFARIPRTVCLIALSAVIFTGILVLMVFALGLILLSVARICPFAASFVYRLFSKTKE